MRTLLHTLVFLILSINLVAQEENSMIQQEINQLVWKPFIASYSELDVETFNQLHASDVLRAGSWAIWQGEEYKERMRENFARNQETKTKRTIELRFDFRKTQDQISYETGFYKVTNQTPGEEPKTFYGYFHVVIKKIDGRWLITQDWDDAYFNGKAIGEEDFAKAKALITTN